MLFFCRGIFVKSCNPICIQSCVRWQFVKKIPVCAHARDTWYKTSPGLGKASKRISWQWDSNLDHRPWQDQSNLFLGHDMNPCIQYTGYTCNRIILIVWYLIRAPSLGSRLLNFSETNVCHWSSASTWDKTFLKVILHFGRFSPQLKLLFFLFLGNFTRAETKTQFILWRKLKWLKWEV